MLNVFYEKYMLVHRLPFGIQLGDDCGLYVLFQWERREHVGFSQIFWYHVVRNCESVITFSMIMYYVYVGKVVRSQTEDFYLNFGKNMNVMQNAVF